MTILDILATEAKERVRIAAEKYPLERLKEQLHSVTAPKKSAFAFQRALAAPGLQIIGEVKKASPSKGIIAEYFPYSEIAKAYDAGGVAAISVLTEPKRFLGDDRYLQEIAASVSVPVLRKDFTVDAYQIYEAAVLGADAILLIVAILTDNQLKEYLDIAKHLQLSVLVEAHDAAEIERAIHAGAQIIGVNNRNLKDFTVNTSNSLQLKGGVPEGIIFVSESGIQSGQALQELAVAGVDAVLIGEYLMRAENIKECLQELKTYASSTVQ